MADKSLEHIRQARQQIEKSTGQMSEALNETNRRLKESLDAQRRQQQEAHARMIDEVTGGKPEPKLIGTKMDITANPIKSIRKLDVGGNIIFTDRTSVNPDEIHSLSAQIIEQRNTFEILEGQEQTTLQTEFESSRGVAPAVQPYKDYLQSQALGKRFTELEQGLPGRK